MYKILQCVMQRVLRFVYRICGKNKQSTLCVNPIQEVDPRPLILFDLNETLVYRDPPLSYPRKSTLRPHLKYLKLLKTNFRLGVYSCAIKRNVDPIVQQIEESMGERIFDIVLDQSHCRDAPDEVKQSLQKPYAKQKPLYARFGKQIDMSKIILIDDDRYKCLRKERRNLILIPKWNCIHDKDTFIPILVKSILKYINSDDDVRLGVKRINYVLRKHKREYNQ